VVDGGSVTGTPGVSAEALRSISTPDRVQTRLGTLEFDDRAPTDATASLLWDHLDFVHTVEGFLEGFPGASLIEPRPVSACREGTP
jgi:hypothetical protein